MKAFSLIALAAVSISCSDKRQDSAWWENEKTIIELNHRLELEQFRAEITSGTSGLSKTEETASDPAAIDSQIALLAAQKSALEEEITGLSEGWDGFRRSVLTQKRASVSGTSFDEYHPGNGKTYQNVVITSIDDSGVAIRHSKGTARFRYEDLSPEGRAYFGLDQNFSRNALASEREQRIAYERWMQESMAAKEAELLAAAETRKREEERIREQRQLTARNTTPINTSPLTASFGKLGDTKKVPRRTYYYSSPYGTRRSTFYRYYTPTQVSRPIYNPYSSGTGVFPPSSGCNGASPFPAP